MFPKVENVSNTIEQMENLTSNDKMYFDEIFRSIGNRQEELFDNLKNEIKTELQDKEQEQIDIYTILVDSDKRQKLKESKRFFDICDDYTPLKSSRVKITEFETNYSEGCLCGIVFWNDAYPLMEDITDNNYSANININNEEYSVRYRFKNSDIFIEKEKELEKIAIQYNIENPLIYNPMARRALEVWISLPENISKNSEVEIDFCLEKNQLKEQLLLNQYLMWNISVKKFEELAEACIDEEKEILPLWDYTFQTYKFPVKTENDIKEFIVVKNNLRVIKRVCNNIYWQMNDYQDNMRYDKYTLYLINDNKLSLQVKEFYHNDYQNSEITSIKRIRTKSDAIRVISGFCTLNIRCRDVYTENRVIEGEQIIYTYTKRMDYYKIKRDERLCTDSCICNVVFEKNDSDIMYIDKISYIISFLNHKYPEYKWRGVN